LNDGACHQWLLTYNMLRYRIWSASISKYPVYMNLQNFKTYKLRICNAVFEYM